MILLKNLLVMKFGGTSMGSAERMKVAARLVAEEQKKRPVVVVVSAMSKITDLLLDTMRQAEAGNRAAVDASLAALRQRHEKTCREVLPAEKQAGVEARIGQPAWAFERIVSGMAMLGGRPPRSVDEAVVTGEWLSARSEERRVDLGGRRIIKKK